MTTNLSLHAVRGTFAALSLVAFTTLAATGCAASTEEEDMAEELDEPEEVEASSDALVGGALAAARAACTKKWTGQAICQTVFIEGGRKILYKFTSGRVCERRGTEWLINSSNGSVTGKRFKCLKWR